MMRYANLSGKSGVVEYEIGGDYITIEFRGGAQYVYDGVKPGFQHVQQMIKAAKEGRGLGTYINKFVGKNYAKRLR